MPLSLPVSQQSLVIEPLPEIRSVGLLEQLAEALQARGVAYCQWKGHWSAHRWAHGEADVDLLVEHDSLAEFRVIACQLGFKAAQPAGERQLPGVESYFGHDPGEHQLLHLHVHYRLLIGEYWRTVYRIPIERAVLETAVPGTLFRVPAPAFQLILFVLRMILRQQGRPLRIARRRWLSGIQIQLASLEGNCEREELRAVLNRWLPTIDLHFFERCIRSLRGESGLLQRTAIPDQLHRRLQAHARNPSLSALIMAAREKLLPATLVHDRFAGRMRLAGGGIVLALVGGDGSGKSTCARRLEAWLGRSFPTRRAHLGNPPRSLTTLVVGAALKLEQAGRRALKIAPDDITTLQLIRHLCTARDCHRLYQKVRRFAARGGIAVCERYPVAQNRSLVGPRIHDLVLNAGPLTRRLARIEAAYYDAILAPDALFVLRLDPELAVLRKPEEPADYVRARGRIIWQADWSGSRAQVIDASHPLPDVIADLKARVWSVL